MSGGVIQARFAKVEQIFHVAKFRPEKLGAGRHESLLLLIVISLFSFAKSLLLFESSPSPLAMPRLPKAKNSVVTCSFSVVTRSFPDACLPLLVTAYCSTRESPLF